MSPGEPSVVVAYSGVHQAYQIALAAQEAGVLERFYCSLLDAPGKWGGRLGRVLGAATVSNRRCDALNPALVVEHPWPELSSKLRGRLFHIPSNDWISAAHRFDRWVSKRIKDSASRVFVGVENCAYHSFQMAKEQGMKLVYDCPGYNARHTQAAAAETARQFGLTTVSVGDTSEMELRKELEAGLADCVLCCSEVHARSLSSCGVSAEKAVVVPLWIDGSRWYPETQRPIQPGKLRVLYAGGITLRKGIPFLVEAAQKLQGAVDLTLVGTVSNDVRPVLVSADWVQILPPVSKLALREIYWRHDVLVLPSLGDSFGFVVLEAMACGLPVVVTENCGVPVPDAAWRVPVMDSAAIARRLELYADDRELLAADGKRAAGFAREYTPERYRAEVGRLLRNLVGGPASV